MLLVLGRHAPMLLKALVYEGSLNCELAIHWNLNNFVSMTWLNRDLSAQLICCSGKQMKQRLNKVLEGPASDVKKVSPPFLWQLDRLSMPNALFWSSAVREAYSIGSQHGQQLAKKCFPRLWPQYILPTASPRSKEGSHCFWDEWRGSLWSHWRVQRLR